jgi:hypothetical protein
MLKGFIDEPHHRSERKDSDASSLFLIEQLVFDSDVVTDGGQAFRGRFDETCRTLISPTVPDQSIIHKRKDKMKTAVVSWSTGFANSWRYFFPSSAVYAVNSRTVSTIRRTPSEALFGFIGRTAADLTTNRQQYEEARLATTTLRNEFICWNQPMTISDTIAA